MGMLLIINNGCKKDKDDPLPTTVIDIDGNIYHTVKIGTQVWMVENLRVTRYRNGDTIDRITESWAWLNYDTGIYCDYDNNPLNGKIYGRLYNYSAIIDTRNLCPAGWHVPRKDEWETLISNAGGLEMAGLKLREVGTIHWKDSISVATNKFGFTALPGGYRSLDGSCYQIGEGGYWWCSTGSIESGTLAYEITSVSGISSYPFHWKYGLSVRCVKN